MEIVNLNPAKFPAKIIKAAQKKLSAFQGGSNVKAITHPHTKKGKLYKLDIGAHYRLVSFDLVRWELMSLESYIQLRWK